MSRGAEPHAEVAREAAYVRTLAAVDAERNAPLAVDAAHPRDFRKADGLRLGRNLAAAAREHVRALAAYVDGGDCGRRLHTPAHEAAERGIYHLVRYVPEWRAFDSFSARVVGRGSRPEGHDGLVGLRHRHNKIRKPRSLPYENYQHARSRRVERPAVAYLRAAPQSAPYLLDAVGASQPDRLIYGKYPRERRH